ncbi:MAG: STAS domain-containing protein [Ginsengibacter sp.]
MKFKIDTKEKMHVILVNEEHLSANMSEVLENTCRSFLDKPIKNIILNLTKVKKIDKKLADSFLNLQQSFAEAGVSMVICCIDKEVMNLLKELEIDDMLNITPTESEAWDIVQMEEIEREYLD